MAKRLIDRLRQALHPMRLLCWVMAFLMVSVPALSAELDGGTKAPSSPYRLRIGDRLLISVYGESNTEREVLVDSAGTITYPLVGTVSAIGKTIDQLRAIMNEKINQFFRYTFVSITPIQFGGQNYTILGQVLQPGSKVIYGTETLLSAIARAGGFPVGQFRASDIDLADLDHAFLLRDGEHVQADFKSLVYEGDLSQNIELKGGDYIYIPSALDKQIYILGEVGIPGSIGYLNAVTLVEAIAQSGGLGFNASSRVIVLRGSLCDPYTFNIDIMRTMKGCCSDFRLQPGDIVYVPPRNWNYLRTLARRVVSIFVSNFASQAGNTAFEAAFNRPAPLQNVNIIPTGVIAPVATPSVIGP